MKKGYVCRFCGRVFYSEFFCRYSLCDEDFLEYNAWGFRKEEENLQEGVSATYRTGVDNWLIYKRKIEEEKNV